MAARRPGEVSASMKRAHGADPGRGPKVEVEAAGPRRVGACAPSRVVLGSLDRYRRGDEAVFGAYGVEAVDRGHADEPPMRSAVAARDPSDPKSPAVPSPAPARAGLWTSCPSSGQALLDRHRHRGRGAPARSSASSLRDASGGRRSRPAFAAAPRSRGPAPRSAVSAPRRGSASRRRGRIGRGLLGERRARCERDACDETSRTSRPSLGARIVGGGRGSREEENHGAARPKPAGAGP